MNFEVTLPFERQAKRLIKKYPSLKNELLALIQLKEQLTVIGFQSITVALKVKTI